LRTQINIKPTLLSIILLFVVCGLTSQNAHAQEHQSDSLHIFIGSDTLHLKRNYTIDFPPYKPLTDSSAQNTQSSPVLIKEKESELNATGSISRGIQVSSNASVSLQSSLYLKIKGNLSDNYTVSGVLTEKTSPLQPIGNTRRLNDFDRVLVTLQGPALTASIGDLDIHSRNGRFGQMNRSIEGLDIEARTSNTTIRSSLGFSYGQYRVQQIQGKDGKQGPYRLSGSNGEKFIIVLAGSEKVRIDDQTLQRGADDDYIIDYNAAEITFTQKRILSSNSRISIEFEYVPDIYLASYSFGKQLLSAGIELGNKESSSFYFSANWQEFRDDQSNPLGNADADQLRGVFAELPDTTQSTQLTSIIPDSIAGDYSLSAENVLSYVGDGMGEYSVTFSFVGLKLGQYRKVLGSIKDYFVYDTLQGEYLPSQRLIAPQSHAVLSLVARASSKYLAIESDIGVSQKIHNLYANNAQGTDTKAWDLSLRSSRPWYEFILGDKYYESGFLAHDKLESLEYYRVWQLTPRIAEEEHLNYGQIRLGKSEGTHFKGEGSSLERSGETIGQQIRLDGAIVKNKWLQIVLQSMLTDIRGNLNQLHSSKSSISVGKYRTELSVGMEEGTTTSLYASNDHLSAGIGLFYDVSSSDILAIHYDQRQDYRLNNEDGSILNSENISQWTDQRRDWAAEYSFLELFNTSGKLNVKYREHLNDSSATAIYGLGNLKLKSQALDDRIRYEGNYLIDEEHIPKYDFQYVQVDTGYGDYSYEPYIKDYIPLPGGRFIRQRVFSDAEEQVRNLENKTRLEYASHSFNKKGKKGIRGRINSESRTKLQVEAGNKLQDQKLLKVELNYRTGNQSLFSEINYSGQATNNHSELYTYGSESSLFNMHELNSTFIWTLHHSSKIGLGYEERERSVEYNALAEESWKSYRPYGRHTFIYSPQQKFIFELKYSSVEDIHLAKSYSETYFTFDHKLNFMRRGRIDQNILLTYVQSDVTGIPYSIFAGRQAGTNWKYTLNTRYTFSNRFQLSMNYSLQERGTGPTEQFLRLEGRTHF